MATSQLSGLASGFDWQNYITQIMDIEQVEVDGMEADKRTASSKISALDKISDLLTAMKDASSELKKGTSDYYSRSVEFATPKDDPQILSASADGTTPIGNYNIEVIELATQSKLKGSTTSAVVDDASVTLDNLSISATISEGSFTVNSSVVDIETTDTLQEVFDKISTATGGDVTAALSNNKIVLTSNGGDRLTLGSSSDTSNFLNAMHLFTDSSETPLASVESSTEIGAFNVNILMEESVDVGSLTGLVDGAGSVTINGVEIAFDTGSDSLRSLMNEINNSDADVLVNYDPGSNSFSITSNDTGSLDITIDDPNGLLEQMGLTTASGAAITYGKNAQFKIDGGSTIMTSNSNTLEEEDHGIPGLKTVLKAVGTETLTVEADTEVAKGKIEDFVTAYNSFASAVDMLTEIAVSSDGEISKAVLAGNTEVSTWKSSIRSLVFSSVQTGNPEISRIFHIGIEFDKDGQMAIEDEDLLNEFLENDPQAVAKLFNSSADGNKGLGHILYDAIDGILDEKGSYETQVNTLNNEIGGIEDEIDAKQRDMEREQARLSKSFVAMEEMQAKINQQMSILQSVLGL